MSTYDDEFDETDETMTIEFYLPKRSCPQDSLPVDNDRDVYEALALGNRLLGSLTILTPSTSSLTPGFVYDGNPEDHPLLDLEANVLAMPMGYPYWTDDSDSDSGTASSSGFPAAPWIRALQPTLQDQNTAEALDAGPSSPRLIVKKEKGRSTKIGKENGRKKATKKRHTSQVNGTVECQLCLVSYHNDPRSKARHERSAQHQQKIADEGGQELPSLRCPLCDKVFTSRRQDSLKRHLRNCNGPDPAP